MQKLDVYRGNLVSSSENLHQGLQLIMEINEILIDYMPIPI